MEGNESFKNGKIQEISNGKIDDIQGLFGDKKYEVKSENIDNAHKMFDKMPMKEILTHDGMAEEYGDVLDFSFVEQKDLMGEMGNNMELLNNEKGRQNWANNVANLEPKDLRMEWVSLETQKVRDIFEIEAQFSDIYICESLFSDKSEQPVVSHEINECKNDTTIMVHHDVLVEMDASSIIVLKHFKDEIGSLSQDVFLKVSCGKAMKFQFLDGIVYFGDIWGQISLKEGILGTRDDHLFISWESKDTEKVFVLDKSYWCLFQKSVLNQLPWMNQMHMDSYGQVVDKKNGDNVSFGRNDYLKMKSFYVVVYVKLFESSVNDTFGWKPGWLPCLDDIVANESETVKGIAEVGDFASTVKSMGLLSIDEMVKRLLCFVFELKPDWPYSSVGKIRKVRCECDYSEEIADFLKNVFGLNQTMSGDYLGKLEDFSLEVMNAWKAALKKIEKANKDTLLSHIKVTVSGHTNLCNLITWNMVLAEYVQMGNFDEVFGLFVEMENKKDGVIMISVLSAYAQQTIVLETGSSIHGLILANAIVTLFGGSGSNGEIIGFAAEQVIMASQEYCVILAAATGLRAFAAQMGLTNTGADQIWITNFLGCTREVAGMCESIDRLETPASSYYDSERYGKAGNQNFENKWLTQVVKDAFSPVCKGIQLESGTFVASRPSIIGNNDPRSNTQMTVEATNSWLYISSLTKDDRLKKKTSILGSKIMLCEE